MKFSMNGFRRQLSADVRYLKELVEQVLCDDHVGKDDLRDAMNDVIQHSNVVNCVYQKDDPDFTDMSDWEIAHIEEEQDDDHDNV